MEAKPSIHAVLPTPGSPKRIGLFLFFLDKISIILSISDSLPITGSILPSLQSSVMFMQKPSREEPSCGG